MMLVSSSVKGGTLDGTLLNLDLILTGMTFFLFLDGELGFELFFNFFGSLSICSLISVGKFCSRIPLYVLKGLSCFFK